MLLGLGISVWISCDKKLSNMEHIKGKLSGGKSGNTGSSGEKPLITQEAKMGLDLKAGFVALTKRAEVARRAFAQLGDNDAIAVVVVENAWAAGMIARMAVGLKDDSSDPPPPTAKLVDCLFPIMVFEENGRSEVCCQRVVETSEGNFEVTPNWESFGDRRGPLVFLIPNDTALHLMKHPSLWERVTAIV